MAATVIHSADVLNFNPVPNPQSVGAGNGVMNPGDVLTLAYPKVGEMRFRNFLFPHVHVMNLHWTSDEDVELHDSAPVDTININFQMAGNLDTTFEGLGRDLNMRPGRHNLVYSPGGGDTNRVAAHDQLEMFHISLDKGYFSHMLGCDDRWSERVQENLLHNRPFAGMPGTGASSARMQSIISEVKQCDATGSMRNLLVQSKVLELLALQIGQFQGVGRQLTTISPADADKLHHLKQYLDTHFLEEHSLAELSRICLLNEFKVKKGFKELFGTTVFGHLRAMRMHYAEQLLLNSSRSVEEVSDLLGYEHAQHFSIAFKKFRGVNPSSIRTGTLATRELAARLSA